ncbi:TonB-dependent hemoglobin/transferrin/lactoferrin family receptor [Sphingomonas sp.]|uniref:TonB-dependent hemoglobin/transferrin/lactoferrin family receptor n=1 Tax=Sphingomonas sp. TaxID=28214 RepID=UPI003D6D0860
MIRHTLAAKRAQAAHWAASSAAIAMILAATMPAHAEEAPGTAAADSATDTITVTATRLPRDVQDVPATVTVIDERRIADTLTQDIKDLVRFEPGVSVRRAPSRFSAAGSSTGRAGNEGFNIRGLEGNRVLIQVDGIRVPDGFSFGAQAAGRGDYVDVGLIKSVEILRGSASALYGSDGLAGAVSFVTSDPIDILGPDKRVGGLARAAYSSADDQFSETLIGAVRSGEVSVMAGYTRRDAHELDNRGVKGTATAPNPQDTNSNAALGKIVWAPDDANRIRLTGEHLDDRVVTNVLSSRSATVLATNARDTTRRDRVSLDWRYTGSGFIQSAQISAYWQKGRNRQYSFEDRNPAVDRSRINIFENRVIGGAAEVQGRFSTGPLAHRLIVGADLSQTRQTGLRDGTVPTAPDVFPTRAFPNTDYLQAGAFIADEISIADGVLTLFPALRFDYYDLDPETDPLLPNFASAPQDGSRLSPKLGAVAKIGGGFSLFGNYARGFNAPEPSQVNQFFENLTSPFFAYRTIPNPNLRPETSGTFEAGLRLKSDAVSLSVTGFTGRYRNFISQEQVSGAGTVANPIVFQFVNLDRVSIKGIEAQFEGRTRSGITGSLAIAYAQGDKTRGTVTSSLDSIDPLKLVMGLGWRDPGDRFGGQLIATHSMRKELAATAGSCTGECLRPDAFTILDATAFVRLGEMWTLRAGVFNLLDKKYALWSDVRPLVATTANNLVLDAFTQPGRNASVSISARF